MSSFRCQKSDCARHISSPVALAGWESVSNGRTGRTNAWKCTGINQAEGKWSLINICWQPRAVGSAWLALVWLHSTDPPQWCEDIPHIQMITSRKLIHFHSRVRLFALFSRCLKGSNGKTQQINIKFIWHSFAIAIIFMSSGKHNITEFLFFPFDSPPKPEAGEHISHLIDEIFTSSVIEWLHASVV